MNSVKINVMLWNCWNNDYCRKERLDWIFEEILKKKYPIILLQQVSNATVVDLTTELKRQNYYYKVSNLKSRKTFEIIASIWKITNEHFYFFTNSEQQKGLFVTDINTTVGKITVGCCELESENPRKQIGQITAIQDFFTTKDLWILGCNTYFPNEYYSVEMNDAWGHEQNKYYYYNYDTEKNVNLQNVEIIEKSRPLRVYISDNLTASNFVLKGTEQLNNYYPSAYFGINVDVNTEL